MPNFIDIQNIKAFPISSDLGSQSSGITADFRVLSEVNLVNIVRSLTDATSFVVSTNQLGDGGVEVEFIIYGHYFKAKLSSDDLKPFQSVGRVFATILIGKTPTSESTAPAVENSYMVVGIKDTLFTGVQFTTTNVYVTDSDSDSNAIDKICIPIGYYHVEGGNREVIDVDVHSLLLLQYDTVSKSWGIPQQSLAKFNGASFEIDGGAVG